MSARFSAPNAVGPAATLAQPQGPPHWSDLTLLFLLILAAVAPYANTLLNGFVYDDKVQVLDNPYILSFRHLGKIFTTTVWSYVGPQGATNYFRPVMTIGYLFCHKLFGAAPWGFHLANILLHAAVVAAVFVLSCRVLNDRLVAFLAAAFFALHPIHSEAVAWVAAVTELEMAFFFLLTFGLFLALPRPAGGRSRWVGLAMLGSFIAALLSKEQALMLPVLATVYEHLYRQGRAETSLSEKLARYGFLWLLAGAYAVLRRAYLGGFAPVVQHPEMTRSATFLSAIALAGEYLWKLLWPAHLNLFYPFQESVSPLAPGVVAGVAALLISAAAFAWLWKNARQASLALVWILVLLLPVLNARYLAANAFAERYLYLPSVGFCWLLAWAWARLWQNASRRKPLWQGGLAAALVLVCGLWTWRIVTRNRDWHDDIVLYRKTLASAPDAYPIRLNLGAVYWDRGEMTLAEREWLVAVRENPRDPVLWNDLGLLYAFKQDYSRAIALFEKAIEAEPLYTDAHLNLGVAYLEMGRLDQAEQEFKRATNLSPLNVHARNRLGLLYIREGRRLEAEAEFQASLAVAPNVVALDNLGEIFMARHDTLRAEEAFARAVALNPTDIGARLNLAALYAATALRRDALEQYQEVLKIDPTNAQAAAGARAMASKAQEVRR